MQNLLRKLVVATATLLAAAGTGPALGGGDDYDAMADKEGKGPSYFGFVRDTRGVAVPDASVVLRPKSGEPVVIKANRVGIYRSHISKDVRPEDVEVACEKEGYKQVRVARRSTPGAMNVETSCTMQRL
jgi:hypothetical protein